MTMTMIIMIPTARREKEKEDQRFLTTTLKTINTIRRLTNQRPSMTKDSLSLKLERRWTNLMLLMRIQILMTVS